MLANQNGSVNDGSTDGRIEFEVDGTTLTVRDVIEGKQLRISVDREPELSPAIPELFPLPVDAAVSLDAEVLAVPEYASVNVRAADGEFLAQLDDPEEFPRGDYCIEFNGAVKTFVRAEDVAVSATGAAGPEPVEFAFDRETTVALGGRSLHSQPEATITVPDDPTALTEAVSVLGSSIKEFSPERSWPTLRGYPPRIERGDALDVPSPLTVPDTGVEVVVRPTYADVYRLSTLSYYLGARMVTGDAPAIRLDTGYTELLPDDGAALERRVEELFRTWFFLDTLARTEGYVQSDRYEYEQVGSELPFYPPNLANLSMSERLMEYLEVDPETVAPYAPAWPTAAVLRPSPAAAELLPHLAHVLAPVRVRGASEPSCPDAPVALATSPQTNSGPQVFGGDVVPSPDADSISPGTSVLTPTSYENRLNRKVSVRGEVTAAFLFDDLKRARSVRESLASPTSADGIGSWSVYATPSRETVTEVLSDPELDIAFCALPVKQGRIEAADGVVEPADFQLVDGLAAPAASVFENHQTLSVAAESVERGSEIGVALGSTVDPSRTRTFVSLLAAGVPATIAVSLAFDGTDARFVGSLPTSIATDQRATPSVYDCRPIDEDSFQIWCQSFLSTESALGHEVRNILDFLESKSSLVGTPKREVGRGDAEDILSLHEEISPVIQLSDNFVFHGDEFSTEDLTAFSRRALDSDTAERSPPENQGDTGM